MDTGISSDVHKRNILRSNLFQLAVNKRPSYDEQLRQLKKALRKPYLESWEKHRIEQHIFHIQEMKQSIQEQKRNTKGPAVR